MNAFANPYQLRPQFFQLFPSPLELHTPRHIQTQANAVPPFFVIHCHRTYDQPPPVLPSPLPSPLRNSQPCPILQPRWRYPPRLRNLPRRNATPPFICMFPPHNATWGGNAASRNVKWMVSPTSPTSRTSRAPLPHRSTHDSTVGVSPSA